jgi:hypothetical protein
LQSPAKPSLSPLALWILLCALLNASGWILSAVGGLTHTGYLLILAPALIASAATWLKVRPRFAHALRRRRFKRALPLAFSFIAVLAITGGLLHAPANYDGLAYRIPRVLHWLAEGQWHWIHTDFHRLNTRGAGIEWVTAPLLLLTGTDRLFFLLNAVSFLFLPGLAYSVMTGLGVRAKVAWHWMWILPCGYCYILQAGSIANDLFGATLALAAIHYALRASRQGNATAAWLSILAAALSTAGKGFNLLILLPWGLAILPAAFTLLRRPIPTFLVGSIAILISLVPTSVLNHLHCGDWKGLAAEPVNLSTGSPGIHILVNTALIGLHHANPTFSPLAGKWNVWIGERIPESWSGFLDAHFEPGAAKFKVPEMQMEEAAGLGFGVFILLLPLIFSRQILRLPSLKRNTLASATSPGWLVPAGAWVAVLYFLSQSGLGCPDRYLAPFYILLLVPLLRLPRAAELLGRRWWKSLVWTSFALAALLLVATPPRPLWPAQTVLRTIRADQSTSPIVQRIWNVYSVYGARADGFSPVRTALPPGLNRLGLVTFDDPETSLWRPFGTRRIMHVTKRDDLQSLKERGISHVLVSGEVLQRQEVSITTWNQKFNAETIREWDLPLRASKGPMPWFLVRIATD